MKRRHRGVAQFGSAHGQGSRKSQRSEIFGKRSDRAYKQAVRKSATRISCEGSDEDQEVAETAAERKNKLKTRCSAVW